MVNTFFRKYQQSLMIIISILAIIAFVGYWNGTQSGRFERMGSDSIGTIYGRRITEPELSREARKFDIAASLGLIDLLQSLASFDPQHRYESFAWHSIIVRHEADALQIAPTDEEVQNELTNLPTLQTNGQFDPAKLNKLVQNVLAPRGFSDTVIDDLLRDDLRLKKIKALIASSVQVSLAEFRQQYATEYEKLDASVIRFNSADIAAGIQISDDDAKKAFEQRKDQLKSDEKRKVQFATFSLSDAEKQIKGKDRMDALVKLRNRAADFTQAMLEKGADFAAVAAKFQVPVTVTQEFTQSTPDPLLAKLPAVSAAAFNLSKDQPNSDVVEGENGYYILHLEDIVPSQPLTFEQAKPKLIEQLKTERAREQLTTKAAEARAKIEADLKAGKSFADAAAAAGVKAETLAPFSIADRTKLDVPDQQEILEKVIVLGEKQISDFTPTEDGGLLVYLDKREPIDEAAFEKDKATLFPLFEKKKQDNAFQEWLRIRRNAAKIQITQR
jgi:peptidyl-prolyl cis-trans isomerase D